MTDEQRPVQDVTEVLADIRAEVMGEQGGSNDVEPPAVPASQIESMHLDELLRQVNQEWDLTRYSLDSKRKNFAQVVTGFKKMLDLVVKPYANIFLYQQATYNSHVVQILNLLGQKLGRIESFISEIATEQSALKTLFEGRIGEVNQKLDRLSLDVQDRHEMTQQTLAEGFAQSREGLEQQRQHFEQMNAQLLGEMEARHQNTDQRIVEGIQASQDSIEQQRVYMDQIQDKIMDDLADGLRASLTEVAQRLHTISTMVERHRHQLEEKLDQNVDTLLSILTEENAEISRERTSGENQ